MKKLILILSVALFLGCKTEKEAVKVDKSLMGVVAKFIQDANEYGVDTTVMRDSLQYITLLPLSEYLYGVYTPKNRQISINMFVLQDSLILKRVLYHELGHVYGLQHSKYGIMATNQEPQEIHHKYCKVHNVMGEANWELHKAIFFRKILENQGR